MLYSKKLDLEYLINSIVLFLFTGLIILMIPTSNIVDIIIQAIPGIPKMPEIVDINIPDIIAYKQAIQSGHGNLLESVVNIYIFFVKSIILFFFMEIYGEYIYVLGRFRNHPLIWIAMKMLVVLLATLSYDFILYILSFLSTGCINLINFLFNQIVFTGELSKTFISSFFAFALVLLFCGILGMFRKHLFLSIIKLAIFIPLSLIAILGMPSLITADTKQFIIRFISIVIIGYILAKSFNIFNSKNS